MLRDANTTLAIYSRLYFLVHKTLIDLSRHQSLGNIKYLKTARAKLINKIYFFSFRTVQLSNFKPGYYTVHSKNEMVHQLHAKALLIF